jgi:hypothetical protein
VPKDLTVIPVGLSPAGCALLLELCDQAIAEGRDEDFGGLVSKVRGELVIARDATLSKGEGITAEVREKLGMRTQAAVEEMRQASGQSSEAERIADKMAKAARKAVEDEPRPVYTADGREVPGLTIQNDNAAAVFRYNGEAVSEEEADRVITAFEEGDETA